MSKCEESDRGGGGGYILNEHQTCLITISWTIFLRNMIDTIEMMVVGLELKLVYEKWDVVCLSYLGNNSDMSDCVMGFMDIKKG